VEWVDEWVEECDEDLEVECEEDLEVECEEDLDEDFEVDCEEGDEAEGRVTGALPEEVWGTGGIV
jgi:hypothetical protein